MKKIIIVSLVIIAIWLCIVRNPKISVKLKSFVTSLVVASPIPPIP